MPLQMQKHTARNLVLSANSQTAYGGALADAALLQRVSIDPSTVFMNPIATYNDQGAAGHGTDFATVDILTAKRSSATVKGMGGTEAWLLGWMLAFIFGQETVTGTGPGPYTHTFSFPAISAQMPCTTAYVEDTNDVHRKYADMAAKTLSIDIPERGPIQGSLDMVGTGVFFPGSMTTVPAVPSTQTYLLGSDFLATITPSGGAATPMSGRQVGVSIKIDRQSAAFEASGDGLTAKSVQSGTPQFSLDMTLMADATDDVNGWFENQTLLAISLATNPARSYQLGFSFPAARIKANKLGNKDNKVAWAISFDQGTCLQVGSTPAMSAFIINGAAAYLVPA